MSAVLGVLGPGCAAVDSDMMLSAMAQRGSGLSANWHGEEALLAVARNGWELADDFSGGAMVVEVSGVVVAADATLYDRESLAQRLHDRRVEIAGPSPSHLIAAAYHAWGAGCPEHLNGDFSFVLWDSRTRRACIARSPEGKRPLFLAVAGDSIVVASTISGVLTHPVVTREMNPAAIAAAACGLVTVGGQETVYRGVRRVAAGETLTWHHGHLTSTGRWTPPTIGGVTARAAMDEGARELREILERAVAQRLASDVTAVWLSGGWDSSALWGIGQHLLCSDQSRRMFGVSISYPPGDPGREDELIAASAAHWGGDIRWLNIADIPLLGDPESEAAIREEPFAHMFETWNRTLARAARDGGARVTFDGFGGDQLFQVSEHYLIDLWRRGRRLEVLRDWHQRRLGGPRQFFSGVARPARFIRRQGVPWAHVLLRPLPPWLDADFVERHSLIDRQREYLPPDMVNDLSEGETRFLLESPYYAFLNHLIGEFTLEAGVESRSPLFDQHVIRLATARPRNERASGRETKRLLRTAVRGLLPDHVLAPRRERTGVTTAYARKWMGKAFETLVQRAMRAPWVLEDLGIVNTRQYREAVAPTRIAQDGDLRVSAYLTLQTELWLRSRMRSRSSVGAGRQAGVEPQDVSRPQGSWAAPSQPLGIL